MKRTLICLAVASLLTTSAFANPTASPGYHILNSTNQTWTMESAKQCTGVGVTFPLTLIPTRTLDSKNEIKITSKFTPGKRCSATYIFSTKMNTPSCVVSVMNENSVIKVVTSGVIDNENNKYMCSPANNPSISPIVTITQMN